MFAIKPRGQGRPRFSRKSGRAYTPETTRAYVDVVRERVRREWGERDPLSGAVKLSVCAWFSLPKRAKDRGLFHTQKPDGDNIAKAALDAITPQFERIRGERVCVWPGVLSDDCIVADLHCAKRWSIAGDALSINIWSYQ